MSRQFVGLKKGNQILGLLVIISLIIGYLFTEAMQVQSHYSLCSNQPGKTQLVDMPKLEIISESVKRIRKVTTHIISIFLLDEGMGRTYSANFQNAAYHRKAYLSKALLMAYIHDVDGKKHNPLYEK